MKEKEEKFVKIHESEWKKWNIADLIEEVKAGRWVKESWALIYEHWDHDHCEICWWKLYESDVPENGIGYHNLENDNWICTECYEQFINTE